MNVDISTEAQELLQELAPRFGLEAETLASVLLVERVLECEMMVKHGLVHRWEAI